MPRPRKMQTAAPKPKKGKPSWDEASTLLVYENTGNLFEEKDDGFVYRWEVNDPPRIQIQMARGWEIVSGVSNDSTSRGAAGDTVDDGKALTTVNEYRELIRMRLPKHLAEERRDYMQQKADKQMESVTGGTDGHGQIEEASRQTGGKVGRARTDVRIS